MTDFWHGLPEQRRGPRQDPPIPEVRDRLAAVARQLRAGTIAPEAAAAELEQFIVWLWRRPAIRRAPPDSRPVTPAMAQLIISLAEQHPDWTEQRIAQECGVKNQGRVSEVLAGYRGRST